MAVIEFDIYAEDDPNGTPLGTISDEDAVRLWFEPHWRKAGVGGLVMNRHHDKASLIALDRYVKCRVPVISEDPLFGWWMRKGRVILSTAQGPGAELLTMEGPGTRDILRYARLLEATYAPVPPASEERGSSTDQGLWRWLAQHRGAIAARVMEEGQNQNIGDLSAPLHEVTFDWDRTNDSNSAPWSDTIEVIEQRIGIDADTFLSTLEEAGGFTLFADPDLTFHAYQSYPARDLTETVTFQANSGGSVAPNVASEMVRELDSTDRWNAILVDGMAATNGGYEVHTDGSEGIAHIGYVAVSAAGSGFAEDIAQRELANSQANAQRLAVEVNPLAYLPGPAGSNGVYWLNDEVHVQSNDGNGAWDIDEDRRVHAIRFEHRIATDGSTDDRAKRSLKITALLNDEALSGDTNPPA